MGERALCVLLLGLLAGSSYAQSCSLITSSVLRVDSEETFIVDGHGTNIDGKIKIQDYPTRKRILAEGPISANSNNGFLGTTKYLVPSKDLEKDPNKKQYVYVTVDSPNCKVEKVVLVSYQSGYIFIQTDKPIYTPGSTVLFNIFTLALDMKPIDKQITIEILAPDNVSVRRDIRYGRIISSYKLSDLARLGEWTIAANFEGNPGPTYTTQFEVKEYILPSFEVKIIPAKKFFQLKDEEFSVEIHADYLYGKPVEGVAYVLFFVKKGDEKKSLSEETLRRITISNGKAMAVLRRRDLVKLFKQEKDMLEWTLGASATVFTDDGSNSEKTELNDIPIVTSPYKILFTKTSKYFKPGMPFEMKVLVTNPDGSPAARIPVVADQGGFVRGTTLEDGTVLLTVNTLNGIESLPITVKTGDPTLTSDLQAQSTITAAAYRSKSRNYLHVSITGEGKRVGDMARISLGIRNDDSAVQSQITHFNYVILNKGRILRVGRQERHQGQFIVAMLLQITPELVPSFRFLAYYVITTAAGREIVADSVWIDVADTCAGTIQLSGNSDRENHVQPPGVSMRLKLRADHKASVGLVAVDKGVYGLNNRNKISQTKVWDLVEKYDTGCTPGGGADAAGVFYDAGLSLGNNFHGLTPQRSDLLCKETLNRRRRDTAVLLETKDTREPLYEGTFNRTRRDTAAFVPTKDIQGDMGFDFHEYIPEEDIISRTEFPESWLWKTEMMNDKPDYKGVSTRIVNIFLKDSITTWEVLPVSLSDNGICVGQPHNIQVFQKFFIDLRLPYAAVRNEKVEIWANLYNYEYRDLRVRVQWSYNEAFCSPSTAKRKSHQYVTLKPSSSVAVPFTIVPLSLGYHNVEVKVAADGEYVSDGVRKKLNVVPSPTEARKEKQCNKFDLSVNAQEEHLAKGPEGTYSTVSLNVCFRYLRPQDSSMSIVTVSMMPGFAVDTNDLDKLKQGKDRFISNFEINKGASDKSTLVLYIDRISQSKEQCLKVRLHQYYQLGFVQPGSVTIYEYYSPENRCTRFYHVDEDSQGLDTICQGEECRCAGDTCYLQQQLEEVNNDVRLQYACATGVDYVFRVTLINIKQNNHYYSYEMTITEIIKAGTEVISKNDKRTFLSHAKCRSALNLQVGRNYLIWGVTKDLWSTGGSGIVYVIGGNTWVEMWPSDRECQNPQNEELCDELHDFNLELRLAGCRY